MKKHELTDVLKEQLARSQRSLIDFLRVDLGLAFTILNTAKIEKATHESLPKNIVEGFEVDPEACGAGSRSQYVERD